MRIARIELDQIGPFDAASIDLPAPAEGQRGELVIFDGPNGSGKSTILEAIACAAAADGSALMPPQEDAQQRLRAPTGAARLILEDGSERQTVTLGASGIAWPGGASESPIAAHIEALSASAEGKAIKLCWAAFAYRAHLATPVVAAPWPVEIGSPPLRGALSFGAKDPASSDLGQLLAQFDHELTKASVASRRPGDKDRAEAIDRAAEEMQREIERLEDALSQAVGRSIHFEFPFGQRAPKVLVDGEEIALARLGEGMRSTLAWLADVLVRLQRAPWATASVPPLDQAFWLILDGIDEGLHPTQQTRILPTLRHLFPNARLYVATHSPFLVASAGCGAVVSLRPDPRHRIAGAVPARRLEQGQSLEWVVEEIFGAETGFIDPETRAALAAHRRDINRLRRKETLSALDWTALLSRRAKLMSLNEEVLSLVAMQEVPVRAMIEARLRAKSEPPTGEQGA
jgi:energy-coupling factor transporter ATP-binding protein EcfA2